MSEFSGCGHSGHGRHGGGRAGGSGRGRGELQYNRKDLETNGLEVTTNSFQIHPIKPFTLYQYEVQIHRLRVRRDDNGERIMNAEGKPIYEVPEHSKPFFTTAIDATVAAAANNTAGSGPPATATGMWSNKEQKDVEASNRSSERSRAIMVACRNNLSTAFVSDGERLAYSVEPLVLKPNEKEEPDTKKPRLGQVAPLQCDVKTSQGWFRVLFTQTNEIPIYQDEKNWVDHGQSDRDQAIASTFLNTAMKSAMLSAGLVALGRSPNTFYFQQRDQLKELMARKLQNHLDRAIKPLIGLNQSASITARRQAYLAMDLGLCWAYNEMRMPASGRDGTGEVRPFKILDYNACTIAGIKLETLDSPVPKRKRAEVAEAIKKLTFHIQYERKLESEWGRRRIATKGEEWVRKNLNVRRPDQRVWRGTAADEQEIMWQDEKDDLGIYKFEVDQNVYTVEQHYLKQYNIPLKFPSMPLVRISKGEYFPIEFLCQPLRKVPNAQSDEYIQHALAFCDEFSLSNRINHISSILNNKPKNMESARQFQASFSGALAEMNLRIDSTPTSVTADVLRESHLHFSSEETHQPSAKIMNGSWNLRDKKFEKPATLHSFAVIDYSDSSKNGNPRQATLEKLFNEMFRSCERHGISVPKGARDIAIKNVWTAGNAQMSLGSIGEDFAKVISQARDYFLPRSSDEGALPYFRSQVRSPSGVCMECLVKRSKSDPDMCILIPPNSNDEKSGSNALQRAGWQPTHAVKLKSKSTASAEYKARVKFIVEGSPEIVDGSVIQTEMAGKRLTRTYEVMQDGKFEMVKEEDLYEIKEEISTLVSNVCCPSLVFVVVPDDNRANYQNIKFISNLLGVQTQVIVKTKFDSQKSPDQYCSNVILKVNAKLATFRDSISAWRSDSGQNEIAELCASTLVIGLSTASDSGRDTNMVVAGTTCLDPTGLKVGESARIQFKSPIISQKTLIEIVLSLAKQYYEYNGYPERVVIYRSSGDDGLFAEIIKTELMAIKKAFVLLNKESVCNKCRATGCTYCIPKITLIIAQTQHNKRVVPTKGTKNVPSGTYVTEDSGLFSSSYFKETSGTTPYESTMTKTSGKNTSFLLIPHGGLKGTSKAVHYHAIYNDAPSLSTRDIAQLTYGLSFQYATATKAPRLPSVLKYSERLATRVIGCISFLFHKHGDTDPFVGSADVNDPYRRANGDARVSLLSDPCSIRFITEENGPDKVAVVFQTPFHPHTSA